MKRLALLMLCLFVFCGLQWGSGYNEGDLNMQRYSIDGDPVEGLSIDPDSDDDNEVQVYADGSIKAGNVTYTSLDGAAGSVLITDGIGSTSFSNTLSDIEIDGSLSVNQDLTVDGDTYLNLTAGVDNSVVIQNSDGTLKTDEIDSRVWGSSLVDGSGFASHIPYWSDSNTLSYDYLDLYWVSAQNRLGIGTSIPTYNLHVEGDGYISDYFNVAQNLYADSKNVVAGKNAAIDGTTILTSVELNDGGYTNISAEYYYGSPTGEPTSQPIIQSKAAKADNRRPEALENGYNVGLWRMLGYDAGWKDLFKIDTDFVDSGGVFGKTSICGYSTGAPWEAITLKGQGQYIGINQPSPSYTLDIDGNARVSTLPTIANDAVVTHSSGALGTRTINSDVWTTGDGLVFDSDISDFITLDDLTPTGVIANGSDDLVDSDTIYDYIGALPAGFTMDNLTPSGILQVTGDVQASGDMTANSFFGDGSNLTGIEAGLWTDETDFISYDGDVSIGNVLTVDEQIVVAKGYSAGDISYIPDLQVSNDLTVIGTDPTTEPLKLGIDLTTDGEDLFFKGKKVSFV